nr:hypothetical protein BC332_27122 [Ipomoea batatas]
MAFHRTRSSTYSWLTCWDALQLAPMPDSYDLDRGLLLSVQAIQALLENKGLPVIVGIGGPSGSGKTSLARKMANIIGCEVVSLESYYKREVKDFKYDDFSSLDLAFLSKVSIICLVPL